MPSAFSVDARLSFDSIKRICSRATYKDSSPKYINFELHEYEAALRTR